RWAQQYTGNGDLAVTTTAALVGGAGLQAIVNDNASLFVGDTSPSAERTYHVRFYFDPNSITMANGDQHYIATGYAPNGVAVLYVELRFSGDAYLVRAAQRADNGVWRNTAWFQISDAPHY